LATTCTTTPSLAPNASGGGSAYFINDYRDPLAPSLTPNVSRGVCIIVNVLNLLLIYLIIYKKCSVLKRPMVNPTNLQ
jgi:hypothetical protein